MWILERETKLLPQNCFVAGKQAEADSMQGKWAGAELHVKTESIAMVGRLVDVLSDPHYLSLMRVSQGVEIFSSEVLAQGLIMHFVEETPLLLPTPSWPTSAQETSCLQKWHTAVKGGFIAS